jgi:Acyclic terpene utilisation family protein AtuA
MNDRPIRIANCSGFYGDHFAAPREMLAGSDPVDVLTGDYLAELTMLILGKAMRRDPTQGYAATFLRQMEDVLGDCLDRGIRVVTNAGGLNPRALAADLSALGSHLGITPRVAVVEGDDLRDLLDDLVQSGIDFSNLDTGVALSASGLVPVTANAYLGAWGIVQALDAGADVVVCGRVTDASVVVGPAAWWHGWARDDFDALAGAVIAGHVIECGPQCTGGNYPYLDELAPGYPGFPIAEVAADGSSVITKQPGTGGAVTVGTVTAQLLYEIAEPAYANPDVVAHFDAITVRDVGADRVAIDGPRGSAPPTTLKVAINGDGGYRNTMTMVLTGLDIEAKAVHAETMLFDLLGGRDQFDAIDVTLIRSDRADAATNAQATGQLRVTVKDADREKVGRRFSNAVVELSLASYAGFFTSSPPTGESAFGIYWPCLVPADVVEHAVVLPDGSRVVIEPLAIVSAGVAPVTVPVLSATTRSWGETTRAPLGAVCGGRSGDKGGNANVGLWTATDEAYEWLAEFLTDSQVRALVPEADDLEIRRFLLPNLRAVNLVFVGILGEGVASSTRPDPQAKGLAEYVRSRIVDVPAQLLGQ